MMIVNRCVPALAVLLVSVCVSLAPAEESWRFPTDRITEQQWQTYLDETRAKPNVQAYKSADQYIVEVPAENAVYVFTTAAHPAHPAVVKRQFVVRDGKLFMSRRGHYAGDQAAYDAWWRQFDELDRKIRENVQK